MSDPSTSDVVDTSANQPADLAGWLAYLECQHPVSIDLGLERVAEVARRMGLFDQPLAERVVSVAGTNGKGTTVAMLEALARAHGLSTACYTSPHLLRYNERLRLNSHEADDDVLVAGFQRVEAARLTGEPVSLTYFEAGTLAALAAIAEQRPALAILEVGLGGRLDAVNILAADVAVITTVAQDHAAFLGNDLERIGYEKAGIMRAGCPVVLGSMTLPSSVAAHAEALGAPRYALGKTFVHSALADPASEQPLVDLSALDNQEPQSRWCWRGDDGQGRSLTLESLPDPGLPLDNAAAALQALALVIGSAATLDPGHCKRALGQVQLAGRMQWQGQWCLDVAHNPHAAHYVARRLAERSRSGKRYALLGMLADKDAAGVVAELAEQIDAWVTVTLSGERARSAKALAETLTAAGLTVLQCSTSVAAGMAWLEARLETDDEVLVCGSFFTVAEALTVWEENSA